MPDNKKIVLILLFIIVAAGSLLRFHGLAIQSLWYDELLSAGKSYSSLIDITKNLSENETHPPAYYVLLHFIEKYIGDSETILRFPSAVAGVLSLIIIFLVGRRLYSYKEGLISAALMSVLWCPVYYSQEARPYPFVILFSLLSVYFLIPIIRSLYKGSEASLFEAYGYLASTAMLSYMHYFGLYLTVLECIWILVFVLRNNKARIKGLLIYIVAAVVYVPLLLFMMFQYNIKHGNCSWIKPAVLMDFVLYFKYLFNDSWVILLFVTGLFAIFILRELYKESKDKQYGENFTLISPTLLCLLWLVTPIVLIYFVSKTIVPILEYKQLLISLPAAYLLLARSITKLFPARRAQLIVTSLITGVFLWHLLFSMDYYSRITKAQWREAVGYVAERSPSYKGSLIVKYAWRPFWGFSDEFGYYFRKTHFQENKVEMFTDDGLFKASYNNIEKIIVDKNIRYVWIIDAEIGPSTVQLAPNTGVDSHFIRVLQNKYQLIEQKKYFRADVRLFKVVPQKTL